MVTDDLMSLPNNLPFPDERKQFLTDEYKKRYPNVFGIFDNPTDHVGFKTLQEDGMDWKKLKAELRSFDQNEQEFLKAQKPDFAVFITSLFGSVVDTMDVLAAGAPSQRPGLKKGIDGPVSSPSARGPTSGTARPVRYVSGMSVLRCPGVSRCIDTNGACIYRQCCASGRTIASNTWSSETEDRQLRALLNKLPNVTTPAIEQIIGKKNLLDVKANGNSICWRHTSRNNIRWEVLQAMFKNMNLPVIDPQNVMVQATAVNAQPPLPLNSQALDIKLMEIQNRMDELEREHLSNMHELSDINHPDLISVDLANELVDQLGGLDTLKVRMESVIQNGRLQTAPLAPTVV